MTDLQEKGKKKSLVDSSHHRLHSEPSRKVANGEIRLSELEQYLWGAANILRGPVDKADFKSYCDIFGI